MVLLLFLMEDVAYLKKKKTGCMSIESFSVDPKRLFSTTALFVVIFCDSLNELT